MASYIESTLAPNERVVANAKVTNAIWVGPVIFALIIALLAMGHPIFLLLGLLVLLIPFLVQRTTNLAVTDRRIIAKFGVLSRRTIEQRISKIESIGIRQGIFARMFNYGTILIHGTGGATTPIRNIADPMKFKGAVEGQIEIYEQTDRTVRGGIGSAIQASTP